MDKLSYALGLGIGRQLSQMGANDLNVADFAQAVKDMIDGKEPQVPTAEAQQISSADKKKNNAPRPPRSTKEPRARAKNTSARMLKRKVL